MEDGCHNCRNRDEHGFCEELVMDTKRIIIDGKSIKSNYIAFREEDDDRIAFITPDDFICNYHQHLY